MESMDIAAEPTMNKNVNASSCRESVSVDDMTSRDYYFDSYDMKKC